MLTRKASYTGYVERSTSQARERLIRHAIQKGYLDRLYRNVMQAGYNTERPSRQARLGRHANNTGNVNTKSAVKQGY